MVREACVVLSLLHTASGKGDDEEGRVVGRLGSVCALLLFDMEMFFFMWIRGKGGIMDCWEERGKALLFLGAG